MTLSRLIRRPRLSPAELLGRELPSHLASDEALQRLVWILGDARVDWARLGPLLTFKQRGYARRVLYRSKDWEMVIVGWLPGQRSATHDHGGSTGVSRVLMGTLREVVFERTDRGIVWCASDRVEAGGVMIERPATIHRVENVWSQPAVTLHLYSPPLRRMNAFDRVPAFDAHEAVERDGRRASVRRIGAAATAWIARVGASMVRTPAH